MNKIEKFLQKLSKAELKIVEEILTNISNRKFESLNFKKLKNLENLYRVRKGKIRIVFYMDEKAVRVIKIDRRNDNTYKDLM